MKSPIGRSERGASDIRAMLVAATAWVWVLAGCRQDMHNQPKMTALRSTSMFADGRSARAQVPNTVARSQQDPASFFMTGLIDGKEVDQMPFPVTRDVLSRGQERYNIYCSPCHSRVGNGQGMIVQRGYSLAADFHTERLREAPLGHFVNVIDHGQGTMPSYAAEVSAPDRWAIAAYVRALQLSQKADISDVPASARVSTLAELADETGLPRSFAQPWRAVVPQQTIAIARGQPTEPAASASGPGTSRPGGDSVTQIPAFNPAAYQSQAPGTAGNSPRNPLHAPVIQHVDGSIGKSFPLHDRYALNFKAEGFNLLNSVVLAPPTTGITSSTFGKITATRADYNPRLFQFALRLEF